MTKSEENKANNANAANTENAAPKRPKVTLTKGDRAITLSDPNHIAAYKNAGYKVTSKDKE